MSEFEQGRFRKPNKGRVSHISFALLGVANLLLVACNPDRGMVNTPLTPSTPRETGSPTLAQWEVRLRKAKIDYPECVAEDPQVELKKMLEGRDNYRIRTVNPGTKSEQDFNTFHQRVLDDLQRRAQTVRPQSPRERGLAAGVASIQNHIADAVLAAATNIPSGDFRSELLDLAGCHYTITLTLLDPYFREDLK